LFGPLDFSRRDLAALNIMRGRDSGLPDYNTVRKYFNLPRISNWSDINPVLYKEFPDIFHKLEELYGFDQLKDVDLYIGGMLESDQGPGPLFSAIIKDQFRRLRDGDRFWFENVESEIFTPKEIEDIRKISLWDVIVNATNIQPHEIQKEVFKWNKGDPCGQPKQLAHQDMKPCIHHEKFDYFMGSEMAFMYGVLLIVVFPAVTVFCAYLTIIHSNTTRRKIKRNKYQQDQSQERDSSDKMYVREILHEDSYRFCKAKFGPGPCIKTVDRKGNVLTNIEFNKNHSVLVKVNVDHPGEYFILIKAKDFHDLVFSFDSVAARKKFLTKIENLLSEHQCRMDTVPTDARSLVNSAETKSRREQRLEHFFREAYAVTFGVKKYKKHQAFGSAEVMRINLTQLEFASALGMKASDVFIRKMFKIVDKERSGKISFKNFLDTLVLFTKGGGEDKLRIMFELCDEDNEGMIDIEDFKTMLSSLIDIAKTERIDSQDVSIIISSMLETAGLREARSLSYNSFKSLLSQFRIDMNFVGLDCKGAHKGFLDMNSNVAR
jgi:dual oxidase